MSRLARRYLVFYAALFVSAIIQSGLSVNRPFPGSQPDLTLIVSLLAALWLDLNAATFMGMMGGLIHAVHAAPFRSGFGSIIVSRTAVTALVSYLQRHLFKNSVIVAIVVVLGGTLGAEILYFVFAPQRQLLIWARGVGWELLYNAVLTAPIFLLLRKFCGAPGDMEELVQSIS